MTSYSIHYTKLYDVSINMISLFAFIVVLGIVAEVIANNTRKPLWGYRSLVYAAVFLGFMSFLVWAHHIV